VEGVAGVHERLPPSPSCWKAWTDLFWSGAGPALPPLRPRPHYLSPGSEKRIDSHPDLGDIHEFILPAGVVTQALGRDELVVYDVRGPRLRNITGIFAALPRESGLPLRVDAASPLTSYLLGPEWYKSDGDHRWMPQRATLRMAAPSAAGQKLYLRGECPEEQLRAGPLPITVTVNGAAPLLTPGRTIRTVLPARWLVGKPGAGHRGSRTSPEAGQLTWSGGSLIPATQHRRQFLSRTIFLPSIRCMSAAPSRRIGGAPAYDLLIAAVASSIHLRISRPMCHPGKVARVAANIAESSDAGKMIDAGTAGLVVHVRWRRPRCYPLIRTQGATTWSMQVQQELTFPCSAIRGARGGFTPCSSSVVDQSIVRRQSVWRIADLRYAKLAIRTIEQNRDVIRVNRLREHRR
jgi:hypothetical protein